jgi:RNA polymerase sigma factor (sigma-70 family)
VLPRLTPEQRDVVELHWLAEMTFPEVAEVVGTTVSNTRVRAHRAYVRLRELLADVTPARELRNAPPTRAV